MSERSRFAEHLTRLADPASSRAALLALSVAFGLANAVALLGWSVINPTNTSWLTADNATHYLGWAFYREEARWTFPLAWTQRVGYPIGASIAFLDSVPLVAILLRPLSPMLPEPFQYLGLYATLCFVLQAYFGFRLSARLFAGHPVYTLLSGLFFLLSPPLTWLVFGHFPHLSHWLMLAGLDFYFRDARVLSPSRWFAPYWVLLVIAGGINPYLAALTFLIALTALARLVLERRCGWTLGGAILVMLPVVLLASMAAFGFLAAPDPSAYMAPGYGEFSLNLLSPINPMGHGSILLPPLPLTNMGQFEGYNYLGIGILALLLLNLVRQPRAVRWLADPRVLPLLALGVVCTILAISSTVTVGSRTLLHVELPRMASVAAQSLRVSGRLFWPTYYLIVLGALSWTFWVWQPRSRTIILALALAVQTADLWTLRTQARTNVDLPVQDPLQSPVWRSLGSDLSNLMVIPPYQCGPFAAPGGKPTYAIFGKLAASQRMRTNSYYAARYSRQELRVHCEELPRGLLGGKVLDARTAYVVSDAVRSVWEFNRVSSHRCVRVDGFNLCTPSKSGALDLVGGAPAAAPFAIGEALDLTAGGNARKYMAYGWAALSGTDGTWTEGPIASLQLMLSRPIDGALSMTLVEGSRAFVTKLHPRLDVDIMVNGRTVGRWSFEHGSTAGSQRRLVIPRDVVAGADRLAVDFCFLNPEAPVNVGEGPDDRLLGLNIRGLVLQQEP